LLVAGAALLGMSPRRRSLAARLLPSGAAAAGILALVVAVPAVDVADWPLLDFDRPGPFDPARTYLGIYPWPDYAAPNRSADLRFGNIPLLAGLTFVNGYSPLRAKFILETFPLEVHGWVKNDDLQDRLRDEPELLDDHGIDGLLLSEPVERYLRATLLASGWRPAATLPNARVWHHAGPPSARAWLVDAAADDRGRHARLGGAPPRLDESMTEARVTLDAPVDRPALLVLKRPAYPGYQATVNGVPVETTPYRGTLVAVPIPVGVTGAIDIAYRPRSLVQGGAVAGAGLALVLGWFFVIAWRRLRTRL
jgi:hypothetical protein